MNPTTDRLHSPTFRIAAVAIIALLFIAALAFRAGNIAQAIRLDAFSVDMARAVAGPDISPTAAPASSLELPEMNRLYGMLALKNGDVARADSYFEKAIEGSSSLVPLVRYARPKDSTLARLAYKLYPSIPDSPAWLADILSPKQPEEALSLYTEAAALDPLNNILWEKIGQLALTLKHYSISMDAWEKACDLNPIRSGACDQAARLNYSSGNWDRVIYYFERGGMPGHPPDWVLMIKAAQKLGRAIDANAYLAQAERANPADYSTLLAQQP